MRAAAARDKGWSGFLKSRRFFALIVRSGFLLLSAVLASQVLGAGFAVILPALSPFLAVCSAVGTRSMDLLFLLCVPLAVLALLKGRWFCSHLCPAGSLAELTGKLRRRSASKLVSLPRLGPFLVVLALGGACLGYPLFLWLDPLAVFSGFFSVQYAPFSLTRALPGIGLVLILLLNLWRPGAWCYRLCPLGALQEILGRVGRRIRVSAKTPAGKGANEGRRLFLACLLGASVGACVRRVGRRRLPIRPPGAVGEDAFGAICVRCGNCIAACPESIIRPDFWETGITGLLTPVIKIGPGYCSEACNACNMACPSGAIARLSLEDKRTVGIGVARVARPDCLAWEQRKYCMVCDEYCPYHAINAIERNGISCPEVDPAVCRGCGLCQTVCPAIPAAAIVVNGRAQRRLAPRAI